MADYEYEALSRSEYEKALRTLLSWQVRSKTISKNDAEDMLNQAMQQYDVEGWSMNLPLAKETSAGRTKTAWGEQYSKATEDWQLDTEKLKSANWGDQLSYAKWAQDEEWRRYNAAQQQYGQDIQQWKTQNELVRTRMQLGQEKQSRLGTEAMSRLWSRQLTEARGGKLSDEQKAKVFESARGQILAGLDPIVDAFQYWTIANKDNKWARKVQEGRSEMSPQDRAEKWELEVEKARTRFKKVNELHKAASNDPGRKLSQGEQQEWEQASLHLTNALQESVQADKVLAGEANYYDRNFASDAPTWERDPRTGERATDPVTGEELPPHYGGIIGAGTSQSAKKRPWRTPETPPAPEWLAKQFPEATMELDPAKYALGGTSALRAKKMTGLTPSAQSWARMLPSEQAGFLSHTRWSGGVPEDTLGRMQAMLSGARSGSRWQPYRR